jgi:uncharacterized protein with NAD-binding domain and iron-sulfur cluster
MKSIKRERVAILGGGMGGLTAAWALTASPELLQRYEVTVYQEGWLLGGKGASVRNRAANCRIEEHGLHIWMGFYENAFRVMREVYGDLDRPADAPLATWRDAFHKHDNITLQERVGDAWRPWHFDGLRDDDEPGDGRPLPSVAEYVQRGISLAAKLLASWSRDGAGDRLRRLRIYHDFLATCLKGMAVDGLTSADADFTRIDDEEFRAWLRRHGANETTIESALVRGFYNLAFSDGDGAGAGTALLGILRMCLGWRGAIYYEMQAGMGETVFAPMYLALKRRGVRFRFFHRVRSVGLSADGRRVERVEVGRQATLRSRAEYEPLIDVEGLPCWPEAPLYEQLLEGDAMRAMGTRFSSLHEDHADVESLTLRDGRDFDHVVLALSLAPLADVCAELVERDPRWRDMVTRVRTVGTLGMQLWMNRDLRGLGWRRGPPVLGSYAPPFDTWADLSHLLAREAWTPDDRVGHVAYLCGVYGDANTPIERFASTQARARTLAVDWLKNHAHGLFPAVSDATSGCIRWAVLHDPEGREGEARLDAQYIRANTHGSERYVLSVAGTTRYRLAADDSGFDNLVLAGDWTRTGLDAGCIEAATMSGLQAARGISGQTYAVVGEAPFFRTRVRRTKAREAALPTYIDRPDEMAIRAPYAMRGVSLDAWMLAADREKTQGLVDRYLNAVGGDDVRVQVLAPWVMVVAAHTASVSSLDPAHARRGGMSETDVAVWVPVRWTCDGATTHGWYLPWVFVDSGPAMASGREIYGFPKNVARVDTARDARGLTGLTMSCPVMHATGVGAIAREASVLDVTRTGPAPSRLALEMPRAPWSASRVPMLFLKQIRDAVEPRRACYQSLVEADARATAVRRWRVSRDPWTLRWTHHASHPIAAELGLDAESVALASFEASFDFVMEPGRVLVERSASRRSASRRETSPAVAAQYAER